MDTTLAIKNFRIFDEDGETFDMKPITILTGCNSSGKSTVVKALSLLCDYFSALKQDKENGKKIVLTSHDLDFTKRPNNLMGNLSRVIHRNSSIQTVTLGIRVHSLMLSQDMDIELGFSAEEDNNNGVINSVLIRKTDGTVVFESSRDCDCKGNLYSLLPEFTRFAEVLEFVISVLSIEDMVTVREINLDESDHRSDEEFEKELSQAKEKAEASFKELKNRYGTKILKDVAKWNNIHRNDKGDESSYRTFYKNFVNSHALISKIKETGILYYLPILDTKLSGDKENSITFLSQCIKEQKNETLICTLKKLKEAFTNSDCGDFKSFYAAMEADYLSLFKQNTFPSNGEKRPKLFSAGNLALKGQEITFNYIGSEPLHLCVDPNKAHNDWEDKKQKLIEQPLNFSNAFEALAILSDECNTHAFYEKPDDIWPVYSSLTERLFFSFIEKAIEEIVVEYTPKSLNYVSSSIINVKRLYPMEADDDFTGILKRYMNAKRNMSREMNYVAGSFLNRWIAKDHFDIGHKITIDVDKEGLGITLRLHQDEHDDKGSLLADSGYGITQLFAILLNIEVAIMERKNLPLIQDDILFNSNDKTTFSCPTIAIEEPEIHLHPNFQAMLAEMFTEAYKEYGIHFIIETHSEYLIRKLQTLVLPNAKDMQVDREHISVIYIDNADEDKRKLGDPHVRRIGIRKNGFLDGRFGQGFFDQAITNIRELQNQEEQP